MKTEHEEIGKFINSVRDEARCKGLDITIKTDGYVSVIGEVCDSDLEKVMIALHTSPRPTQVSLT